MVLRVVLIVTLLTMSLAACDKPTRELAQEPEIATLRSSQADLISRVNSLEAKIVGLEAAADPVQVLKRSDNGYSVVKTDFGAITLQIQSITAEGTGSRVVLQIGNTTTATITKLMLFGHWGAVNKDGDPEGETHSLKQPTITKRLLPGTWSDASFLIEGAKPADLGYLRITSALIGSITLNKPPAD